MRQLFSAAIFDMDGLLVDSERTIMNTWITVGLDLGIPLSANDYLRIVGRSSTERELIRLRLPSTTLRPFFMSALLSTVCFRGDQDRLRIKLIVTATW
ncbi:hypothetical protein [Telmatospirillum sp.]|nr:hypothetical protein [Telmatospirillum sp.]MDR3436498.1 hypothetical protein [Telmatospirillum sp.]